MSRPTTPTATVIVPAHNEGVVIRRCLDAVLADADDGELDVIVVANACSDDTAARAREAGVRVLETQIPGKAAAIRLGDAAALAFPRLYLDADVIVDTASVRALVAGLSEPGVLACAPVPRLDLTAAGPVVRRVHLVHDLLIAPQRVLAGVGLYALSRESHRRAFPLPEVLADDEWVHRSFAPHERKVVTSAFSVVTPSLTVRSHLHRRARVRAGNEQLRAMGLPRSGPPVRLRSLTGLLRAGAIGPLDALCYLVVTFWDRVQSSRRRLRRRQVTWGTDASSRSTATGH